MKRSLAAERDYRQESMSARKSVTERNTKKKRQADEAGLKFEIPDTSKQQAALAAASAALVHPEQRKDLMKKAGITLPTMLKYEQRLTNPAVLCASPADLMNPVGRPRKYSVEDDAKFVEWVEDKEVPLSQKTMKGMIAKYTQLMEGHMLLPNRDGSNPTAIRQHIYAIINEKGWKMVKPVTIDVRRCGILKELKEWFQNPSIRKVLTNVPPSLLFNADETDISRKCGGFQKVCVPQKKQKAAVVGKDLNQNHMSLFLIVSAAGQVVKPYTLIHQAAREFSTVEQEAMTFYKNKSGYMDTATFFKIINEVFIPYVENVRQTKNLLGKRAVLVVDGHVSRFHVPTAMALMKANIDLVVLPPHTSHVTQPLDLGLNHFIKDRFRELMMTVKPVIPWKIEDLLPKKPGRPKKRGLAGIEDEEMSELRKEALIRGIQEDPEKTIGRVGRAAYERAKIVSAAIEAIDASLTTFKVKNAWTMSFLYPLQSGPHYTQEQEDTLLRQVAKEDSHFFEESDEEMTEKETDGMPRKKKRGKRKTKHMTGVITSEEGFAKLQELVKTGKESYESSTSEVTANTPQGNVSLMVETDESEKELCDSCVCFAVTRKH